MSSLEEEIDALIALDDPPNLELETSRRGTYSSSDVQRSSGNQPKIRLKGHAF